MDLVSMIIGLPLAPFKGLGALLEVLRDQAEQELYDPTELRSQAEQIDELLASGQITPDEAEKQQEQMLEHLQMVPGESVRE